MDYVSKVVGVLHIKDIDLKLTYMEIIDLSSDDFKISPRLRASLRNDEIASYSPGVHYNAKRIKRRHQSPTVIEKIKIIEKERKLDPSKLTNFSDLEGLTDVCVGLSHKMDALLGKVDRLIQDASATSESTQQLNTHIKKLVDKDVTVTYKNDKLDKLIDILVDKETKEDKLDKLLEAVNTLISEGGVVNSRNYTPVSNKNFSNDGFDDSIPMYVPSLDTKKDFGESNIKTKKVVSEGTGNILAKLKKMKDN